MNIPMVSVYIMQIIQNAFQEIQELDNIVIGRKSNKEKIELRRLY